MKRIIWRSFLILIPVFFLVYTAGSAAPSAGAVFGTDSRMAPGSVMRFEHITIEDGPSQNAGLVIYQDQRGYLWIGTQDGLNRYDGYDFQIFKHDPDDPSSLSHNSILSIAEDLDGSLWIGTWGGGLNHYDPATEKFSSYLPDPDDPASLSDGTVTSIKLDTSGTLWVGTLGGLDRYNRETGGFDHFRNQQDDPTSLSSNVISVVFEDSHNQLWIGTGSQGVKGSGLNRFDPSTGKAIRYEHQKSNPQSLASDNIAAIYEAPDGMFWIATGGFSLPGGGLDQFNPQTGKARHFSNNPQVADSLSGNNLMSLWGDANGTLWIGTWANGLDSMQLSNPGQFEHYQNDPFFADSLSGNEVWSLFKDRSGVLWIGTSHSGLNKLLPNAGQFGLYRNNPSDSSSLSINAVGTFSEDRHGNIWVGTWGGGLDLFNPAKGTFQHFRHNPEDPNSLSDDLIMDVFIDSNDIVWAGTLGKELNRLDPKTGQVTRFRYDPKNPASLANDNIATIVSDKQGGLWIGTFGGLSHLDPRANTFTNYISDLFSLDLILMHKNSVSVKSLPCDLMIFTKGKMGTSI